MAPNNSISITLALRHDIISISHFFFSSSGWVAVAPLPLFTLDSIYCTYNTRILEYSNNNNNICSGSIQWVRCNKASDNINFLSVLFSYFFFSIYQLKINVSAYFFLLIHFYISILWISNLFMQTYFLFLRIENT